MDFQNFIKLFTVLLTILEKPHRFTAQSSVTSDDSESLQLQILALDEYLQTQIIVKHPDQPAPPPPDVPNMSVLSQLYETAVDKVMTGAICGACNVGIGLLMFKTRDANYSVEDIRHLTTFGCKLFQIGTPEVCDGIIERYGPVFRYLFISRPNLRPDTFCGVMLQSYGCTTYAPELEWELDIPPTPARFTGPSRHRILGRSNAGRIKIIQMSDLHVDSLYEPGSTAECDNKILCCQGSQGRPLNTALQAGAFADNRKCDPPLSALEMALENIATEHPDAELFYLSGDIVPHNIWSTTRADNTKVIRAVAKLILEYFPTMKILPVLGNHEPHPVNFFSPRQGIPDDLSNTWIYNVTFDSYKQWIPVDQHDLYLSYGYYAVEITDAFKILVLNTNICYEFNVWQMYEPGDIGGQLKWVVGQLQEAEGKGQKVHIVGHVPPGHDECFRVFAKNFYNIILRYYKTVTGQFYGHTHYDELKVIYDLQNRPVNIAWISPSLTAYEVNNVAYRVYYADPATYDILDHETWLFDLDLANENASDLKWFSLYSGSTGYGLIDTTPESMGEFVEKMAVDPTLFQTFYKRYHKLLDTDTGRPCNTHCRKRILCGIVKSYSGEVDHCNRIQVQVDGIVLPISLL